MVVGQDLECTESTTPVYLTYMTVIVLASYVLVPNISSLYFRTYTNLLLQDEVPEERNDDDYDDNDDYDVSVDTASTSHTHVTHVSDLPTFSLPHPVPGSCYQKHTNLRLQWPV
jgi:hypothetical protein